MMKGLVFGVLNVKEREIVWLEVPFGGQTVTTLNAQTLESYLDKLDAKTSIGALLTIKAKAQKLEIVDTPEADEVYTNVWAMNSAAVSRLLIGE